MFNIWVGYRIGVNLPKGEGNKLTDIEFIADILRLYDVVGK